MAPLKLGYWDIRGLGEPIRMMLKYLNIEFEEVRYGFGDDKAESFPSRDEWLAEKFNLGMDFPNLPYLIEGDLKMTQSVSILKHLARANGLVVTTEPAQTELEMFEAIVLDILHILVFTIYMKQSDTAEDFEKAMETVRFMLASSLKQLDEWFDKNGCKWLGRDQLTYVDFMAYEYLDWYRVFAKSKPIFEKFPNVSAYMKRFEELPNLKEYIASDQHRLADCVSPFVRIGHRWAKE